jgi:hypothetical protein
MKVSTLALLGICICFLCAFIMSAGCISLTKEILIPSPEPIQNAEPIPTHALETSKSDVYQSVVYIEASDLALYRAGQKKIGDYYTWHRENVSGKKDMTVRVSVYDYKIFSRYQWWSDSNGKYYWQFPEEGTIFLFIFAHLYMVGDDPSQDPRYYVGSDPWKRFFLQVTDSQGNQSIIAADNTSYQRNIRIRELEETFTKNDDSRVRPFGYAWEWRKRPGGNLTAGWVAISPEWLRMGLSNAWDGYVLFEVPVDSDMTDVKVLSQWDRFGNPWWQL